MTWSREWSDHCRRRQHRAIAHPMIPATRIAAARRNFTHRAELNNWLTEVARAKTHGNSSTGRHHAKAVLRAGASPCHEADRRTIAFVDRPPPGIARCAFHTYR
jgi:hypothetical protein